MEKMIWTSHFFSLVMFSLRWFLPEALGAHFGGVHALYTPFDGRSSVLLPGSEVTFGEGPKGAEELLLQGATGSGKSEWKQKCSFL